MTEGSSSRVPPREGSRRAEGKPGQAAKILVAGLSASVTLGLVASMGLAASGGGEPAEAMPTATPAASDPLVVLNGQTIRLHQLQQYLDALAVATATTPAVEAAAPSAPAAVPAAPSASSAPAPGPSASSTPTVKAAPAPAAVPAATPAPVAVPAAAPAPTEAPAPMATVPPAGTVPAPVPAIVIDIPVPVPVPTPVPAPAPIPANGSSRQS